MGDGGDGRSTRRGSTWATEGSGGLGEVVDMGVGGVGALEFLGPVDHAGERSAIAWFYDRDLPSGD